MSESAASGIVSPTPSRRTSKERRLVWVGAVLLLLLSVTWYTQTRRTSAGDDDLAGDAVVTASSTALGFSARDVVTAGSADAPGAVWQSAGETSGAWIQLDWQQTHVLRTIVLVRNPVDEPGITDGFLTFGDGSYLQVRLSSISRETVVPISPRSVARLRFTASQVSAGAHDVTIAEIVVSAAPSDDDVVVDRTPDRNAASSASVVMDSDASASDPHAVQDGSGAAGASGIGTDWTVGRPVGAWVQLNWSRARELSSLQLVGSGRTGAQVTRATVVFADGSQLSVGAVLADPSRPTTLSFMPRITTSVRLTIDEVSAAGPLALGEFRAYQRGALPVRSVSDASPGPTVATGTECPRSRAVRPQSGLVIRCPLTGSLVGDTAILEVDAAMGYTEIAATVWSADGTEPTAPPVRIALDAAGTATVPVSLAGLPPGPVTAQIQATGPQLPTSSALFQLYREGATGNDDVPSSTAARGRTLTYEEDFDRPVSLSRSGLGADYAGAKPTYNGAQDFGDAVFPDDASGLGNVKVVDNRYLRISVEPTPDGYEDPSGGTRTHVGGLLASSRQGGSGFSAQYGYFEARMLVPAAPGTWPAFWMLPSDNLIAPTPVVAEVDAVELYGKDPTGACESTHEYKDGKDGGVAHCGQRFPTTQSALTWHTYGVSILPTSITFYIDGRVVATAPQVQGGASPMFFLLDLALGGGWPVNLHAVQNRADLYVDYVRVYV